MFPYLRGDGTIRRELRPPEEVFHPDSLASFALVPLTNDHPWREPNGLDGKNAHAYACGAVGNPRADATRRFVEADLMVTDARAVADIRGGKQELSCGYNCDLEPTSGVWRDPVTGVESKFDAIQRNIRGNHVALVDKGRAGPEARVRLDSADSAMLVSDSAQNDGAAVDIPRNKEPRKMALIKMVFDGISAEVDETAQALISRERKNVADMLDAVRAETKTAKADADKHAARADAAEAQIKDLTAKLADANDPKRLDSLVAAKVAAVAARASLETEARKVLGADAKFDGKTDTDVRKLVIAKLDSAAKLDGKTDEYVTARFDMAIAALDTGANRATVEAQARINASRKDGETEPSTRVDNRDPVSKFNDAIQNAWKGDAK